MITKVRMAYNSGTLPKKAFNGFINIINRISINSYRFRRKLIHKKCSKIINRWYSKKENIVLYLKNILGDYSNFTEFISKSQKDEIIILSEKYLKKNFNLLGSGNTKLDKINWHKDFKSGFIWRKGIFYKDYNQERTPGFADVKIPRELSRCHHFLILGEAYLITKDEKYTREFLSQILNWIDENPLMYSINWGCTMDVSIRAVNWIWSLAMFIDSNLLNNNNLIKIFISLYEHGWFIYRNPEKSIENSHNHYISDLVGQIYLGLLFKKRTGTKNWLNKGMSELFREMRWQILPSGVDYERSINYHRLVLELFSSAIILLKKNDFEIPLDIWYRLEKMYEFVMYYTKPDGTAPIIGDQDDGRLHPFSISKNIDHRYLLSIATILFNKSDFKQYSKGFCSDCYFLLGEDSKKEFDNIEVNSYELRSKRFSDAGFFIMKKNDNYMFINISGKSKYDELSGGTHTHSDLLSFELAVSGKTFLIDPGSYVYTANPKERKLFRSTKMHNTVVIDGLDQNIIDENIFWDFERNAIPKINKWKSTDKFDFFDGEHTGYLRLKDPITHRRTIYFDKRKNLWEITDYIIGKKRHKLECFFHFDINIDFSINRNIVSTYCKDDINIIIAFDPYKNYMIEKENGWVSTTYGERKLAKVLKITIEERCPLQLKTTITKK